MLPDDLTERLRPHLDGAFTDVTTVGGGCIANACRVETDAGTACFLKWGAPGVARTFPGEAAGLKALRAADPSLIIPDVIAIEETEGDAPGFLLMEWIETGSKSEDFWTVFGEGLAAVHRSATDGRYGFDRDNHIGRLPQENGWMERWPAFFRKRRLEPQVRIARERGRWQKSWNASLEELYDRLPDLLPARPEASLLHGDLWSGNFMADADGRPVLIDPAAYHGHREADLAMTELFGGFAPPFYDAYRAAWPLAPGCDERRAVYNLYHLINHLNHFGGSYARQVASTLKRFT